jgi:hypothetical protein
MGLAAVELATGCAGAGDAFQRHVQGTVARFLPADHHFRSSSSGLEVAHSLRHLESPLDLCRALLCDEETRTRLHSDGGFRGAVLGDAASGLYALNRRGGRFRMSASHQIDLLELVKDDLVCIYLQYRVVAFRGLHPRGERNSIVTTPAHGGDAAPPGGPFPRQDRRAAAASYPDESQVPAPLRAKANRWIEQASGARRKTPVAHLPATTAPMVHDSASRAALDQSTFSSQAPPPPVHCC